MNHPKDNGLASPQSQPVQNTLTNTGDFTEMTERLQSATDALLRLACGDGSRMGQVTGWTTNWRDFSESLSEPMVGEKRGAFWCAADYGDSTRRNGDSVQAVSLIVLDVEAKAKQPPPLAYALALCEARGWRAFAHTTYTHKPDAPRYRLCMTPSRTIKPVELRHLVMAVAQELELESACDLAASGDPARLYYTPRVASEADKAMFEHGTVEGAAVDVDEMLISAAPLMIEFSSDSPTAPAKRNGQLGDDLRSALDCIDADTYESWIAGLMAIKTAPISDGQELAHWWSAKSAKYNYEDCQAKWESLKPTQTSYKSIFLKAQRSGWVNPQTGTSGLADISSLLGKVDSETGEIGPLLKPVSVIDVLTNPSPPPEFVWDGYLPRGVVSMLGAHGGTGKSTVALMLCVSAVLGRPLFGVNTVQCKTLFLSLEDSASVVRHRLANICRNWGINPAALDGKLTIADGTEYPELFSAENRNAGDKTRTYYEMNHLVKTGKVGLVVIDNASDAYGGDEIQRRQVRAFIRSLMEVAKPVNCALLLLAHVDKNTSRQGKPENGEGYSGSTAWHNSVRSRLFMTRDAIDRLTIDHQKSNLGRCHESLRLQWLNDELPQLVTNQAGGDSIDPLLQAVANRDDEDRAKKLLRMIAEFASRGQFCSPATTSRNHVHATLKSEPEFSKMRLRTDDTKRLVNQCQRAKWIEQQEYRDFRRKLHQRWVLTDSGRLFAGLLPEPTAPTAPTAEDGASQNMAQASAPTAPTGVGGVGE